MRRNAKAFMIGRSKMTAAGTVGATVDGIPIILHTDGSGNLWVTLAAQGAAGPETLVSGGDNVDAVAAAATGRLFVASRTYGWSGAAWDRIKFEGDATDNKATNTGGVVAVDSRLLAFNNATYDRLGTGAAAIISAFSSARALLVTKPGSWAINLTPAAATQATITRAAGAAGVRHVATGVSFGFNAIAIEAGTFLINLRDGATGAGTILQSWRVGPFPAGGSMIHSIADLNIFGSTATAMTLEFAVAPAAGNFEFVDLHGYDAS